ncbi:MAG TPA: divalent cation tolerance protein CutA [Candidatus Saccharimonadales bacterium]
MGLYYQVKISAETQEQADAILNSLLEKKLATGGQFIKQPARFLWKGKVQDSDYITITTYTTDRHKDALMDDVRKTSTEEVPMITFTLPDDLNVELRNWIDETLS